MEPIRKMMRSDTFSAHNLIELVSVAPGQARARMTLTSRHLNGLKTVHGGAIFSLADFAFAAAANAHGPVSVAINGSITFMKAATTGTLWAEAREVSRNFKLGAYVVEVRDDQHDLVAVFQGTAYRKRQKPEVPGTESTTR